MIKTISWQSSTNSNKRKHNKNYFNANQIQPGIQYKKLILKKGNQPPKNNTTKSADIKIILEYLLKKIMQK